MQRYDYTALHRDFIDTADFEPRQASSGPGSVASTVSSSSDHVNEEYKAKYERLQESYKRLQRNNISLEEKLLNVSEKFNADKNLLSRDLATQTQKVVEAKLTIQQLNKENFQLKSDLKVALQLLQNKPNAFVHQKLANLPSDLQARVRDYYRDQEREKLARSAGQRISVTVTSAAGAGNRDTDEAISAAILAKVLEQRERERSKDKKFCIDIGTQTHHWVFPDSNVSVSDKQRGLYGKSTDEEESDLGVGEGDLEVGGYGGLDKGEEEVKTGGGLGGGEGEESGDSRGEGKSSSSKSQSWESDFASVIQAAPSTTASATANSTPSNTTSNNTSSNISSFSLPPNQQIFQTNKHDSRLSNHRLSSDDSTYSGSKPGSRNISGAESVVARNGSVGQKSRHNSRNHYWSDENRGPSRSGGPLDMSEKPRTDSRISGKEIGGAYGSSLYGGGSSGQMKEMNITDLSANSHRDDSPRRTLFDDITTDLGSTDLSSSALGPMRRSYTYDYITSQQLESTPPYRAKPAIPSSSSVFQVLSKREDQGPGSSSRLPDASSNLQSSIPEYSTFNQSGAGSIISSPPSSRDGSLSGAGFGGGSRSTTVMAGGGGSSAASSVTGAGGSRLTRSVSYSTKQTDL